MSEWHFPEFLGVLLKVMMDVEEGRLNNKVVKDNLRTASVV
jgi:hypothetical protein